ncbi:hypothetical protein [uncultured Oscillibacter sp.]|uniref:hypothetical protein n=1 Tax=uncultured Oscillibacter sp. TaxID=876091 RepID=UPI002601647F|nr:hypothetical protein [uncultured Oscillibacter sp.]
MRRSNPLSAALEQFPKILRKAQRSGKGIAALPSLADVSLPASSALLCIPCPCFLFSHDFWELLQFGFHSQIQRVPYTGLCPPEKQRCCFELFDYTGQQKGEHLPFQLYPANSRFARRQFFGVQFCVRYEFSAVVS